MQILLRPVNVTKLKKICKKICKKDLQKDLQKDPLTAKQSVCIMLSEDVRLKENFALSHTRLIRKTQS